MHDPIIIRSSAVRCSGSSFVRIGGKIDVKVGREYANGATVNKKA